MAKKNKPTQEPMGRLGVSNPESFTHGMVGDLDPHFQLKGSYSDAQNIRLTNSEGDTFTVENIEGNSLFVDLAATSISTPADQGGDTDYPTFYDRGPVIVVANNAQIPNRCSIVGHVSYANQMLLMIVGRFEWNRDDGNTPFAEEKDRTIFLMVDFNHELKVTKVTDLRVCYTASGTNYPDLNMDLDVPVSIEHIVENESISRIYWTDNKNQLRTLNIKQERLDLLEVSSLDITPLMNPSQPVLGMTVNGSLPVGVYQYTYKYISENGGESTFAPLSNMYHVSDQSFTSSTTYAGGPKGNLGTQGFQIDVYDLDDSFEYIELYALFYDTQNQAPRVAVVGRNQISGTKATFQHPVWNNEVPNGLEEILIESNTFDVCKDIAIKDNILFAANLRQKRNFISEKEWNVKVLRWRIGAGSTTKLDAMLTTNDHEVKHFTKDPSTGVVSEISSFTQDYNDEYCGHGQLLGSPGSMYPATNSSNDHMNYDGTLNNPMWTTALSNQRKGAGWDQSRDYCDLYSYRYLSDRMTLGGESFEYAANLLGGCRVSFGIDKKIADQSQNAWSAPFVSSGSTGQNLNTEYKNSGDNVGNTTFKASMNIGGSKDPHLAGDKRGYQRGDIYRFGVQIYDLNGSPGNVLWIGDIETPHQHDLLRMVDIKDSKNANYKYSPKRPTITGNYAAYTGSNTSSLSQLDLIVTLQNVKDHRLSYLYGHTVPPVDLEWFSKRLGGSPNDEAYIKPTGAKLHSNVQPGNISSPRFNAGRAKSLPAHDFDAGLYEMDIESYDNVHYLYDLYVAFEFIIPDDVVKKISGFRVVRAERTEEDRRIVQQGLLNQTAQYGDARYGLHAGYDDTRFCRKDNEAFDDDPIFVNQFNNQDESVVGSGNAIDPTKPEQPEYNVYLNGYLGLAENSHLAFYDDSVTDGQATSGNINDGSVFYWPEKGDAKKYTSGKFNYAANVSSNDWRGPGAFGNQQRHSAYFGSFDKTNFWYGTHPQGPRGFNKNSNHIDGSIFTLDAPDSAFGIRPYVYREGDMLRIDCSMKLTDEVRYKEQNQSSGATGKPHHWWSNCRGLSKKNSNLAPQTGGSSNFGWSNNGNAKTSWNPEETNHNQQEALSFASRKQIDDDYAVLIGKYYCYDPSFGIGMEIDGGNYAAQSPGGGSAFRPQQQYGWQLPIASSKEISDGEIIPKSFFKYSLRAKAGMVNGFSNNTLGYVKRLYLEKESTTNFVFQDQTTAWGFGAVSPKIAHIQGVTAPTNQHASVDKKDYNYDTVSTMQMGLRSILIEVDNRSALVRKMGSAADDTWFFKNSGSYNTISIPEHRYNSWFAPLNLSAIYEHSSWQGKSFDGITDPAGGNNGFNDSPTYSGFLSDDNRMGKANSETEEIGAISGVDKKLNQTQKSLVPFKYLCAIVRYVVPYGGYTKAAIEKTRYIPCGNFHPITPNPTNFNNTSSAVSQVFGGDTFVNLYSHQKTSTPYMKKSAARFQVFPVESYVNTDMRSGLTLNAGDTVIGKKMNEPPFSNDWLYNSVYSQENNIKSGLAINEETYDDSLSLPYEIAYSNTKILGQSSDAFRRFPINQFHDMEGLYGEINKIVNFKNEIYVLQDNAFAKLLVNPLSMLSDDSGTSLFTGTGETVENHIYISTKYGSRHKFSVAASEKSLYFVDSTFGRLFKYDTEKLISLGDALGQRNYLKYIIKEWEQRAYRICSAGDGTHSTLHGMLDSVDKPDGSRNYLSDNPLNFLGITSIYDFKNKELLVTFHNSAWNNKNDKRQQIVRTVDNHNMGSTIDGEPVGTSETLVYSEAVNAFISKYSVAPPQWLTGGKGSFILCPENEMNVNSLGNFDVYTGSSSSTYSDYPYSFYKTDMSHYRNRRCNPLRLWLWDKHIQGKKTNFFGKKDDVYSNRDANSPFDETKNNVQSYVAIAGSQFVADESYIVKVINAEAASAKVFDNAEIIMTPKYINFSTLDYTTDISHDTITATSVLDNKTELLDETEQLVINRRWEFNGSSEGWYLRDNAGNITLPTYNIIEGAINLEFDAANNNRFVSPDKGERINLPGKYNNIIRMRVKRTEGDDALTNTGDFQIYWSGHDPIRKKQGDYKFLDFSNTRTNTNLSSNTDAGQTYPVYGPNLIVNGGFGQLNNDGTPTGWNATATTGGTVPYGDLGGVRIKSEDLSATGGSSNTNSYISQYVVQGSTSYLLTYDILQNNGGSLFKDENPNTSPTSIGDHVIPTTVGHHEIVITYASTGSLIIRRGDHGTDIVIDNITLQKVLTPQAPIDEDYQIIEWDMSGIGDAEGTWDDCIIEKIRIDLSGTTGDNKFSVDWIEIGGLEADKYIDGVLKAPLRTEKSKRRTRGTWAKVKYSAKTTEKFNIFAILAKYRKTY